MANEKKPKGRHIWRAPVYPCPVVLFCHLLMVTWSKHLLAANPTKKHVFWEANSLPPPVPFPQQSHRQPGWLIVATLLECHRKGKALLISERFFLSLKITAFKSCSAMGRIIKGYSKAVLIVTCYTSTICKSFSPFWE